MGTKYAWNFSLLMCLSLLFWMVEGLEVLDDKDSRLVYSNTGPGWWAADWYNGGGRLVGGHSNQTFLLPSNSSWHETKGDGASVALTFTGTRVTLNVTICDTIYDTVLDFFIDGENKGRYEHYSAGPVTLHDAARCDPHFRVTIADFGGLSAAQHTFKAVTVGDVLFVVDSLSYEAATPVASTPLAIGTTVPSSTSATPSHSSTSSSPSSPSSSPSSRSSSTSTSPSTLATENSQPVVSSMDVPAADSRILYAPPGAWKQFSNARRTTSCLDGTMSSSTVNSSLTYNFTGPAIQVYTMSSPNGGHFSITLDGQAQGVYSSYDASSDPYMCLSKPLYSAMGLTDTQHTLVLTVQDGPSGSTQNTVQFVGLRTSSSTTASGPSSSGSSGPNLAPIIGGVAGGISGLIFLFVLVIWWMRRQRRIEEADLVSKMPHPLRSSFSSLSKVQRELTRNDQVHRAAESFHASRSSIIPSVAQRDRSRVSNDVAPLTLPPPPPPQTVNNDGGDDDEDDGHERLTYYTLPSYHENVRQTAATRNLSEADVNAISRRLQEVMRTQMVQAGRDPNELMGMMPPRELIDHLVEEQLQPRAE